MLERERRIHNTRYFFILTESKFYRTHCPTADGPFPITCIPAGQDDVCGVKNGPWNSLVYASNSDILVHAMPGGHGKHTATCMSVLLDDGYVPSLHDIVHGIEPFHKKETS